MHTFESREEFFYDGQPYKIISGAIHYFRVVPEYWRDRLEKLKALGCNTVETYVPWNLHEPQEGQFCFDGQIDLRKFIQLAAELELKVILRPAPYICAEWEFGGLPYWLMNDTAIRLRFNNPAFMKKIEEYYEHLLPEILDLQITQGGPIILVQVENEYGGYGNDKDYLEKLVEILRHKGIDVPLVTSDGPWGDMLENGSIPELALPTINCGSKVDEHLKRLQQFHGRKRPLMVMEFWIGWFDAWGDKVHHVTDEDAAAQELDAILSQGSVNIYMFHGGTNFGFTNGANYYERLAPDVTSYDYDALLTEWGDITEKYRKFQQVIARYTELPTVEFSTRIKKKAYGEVVATAKTSLFANLDRLSTKVVNSYPIAMEKLKQAFGYVYYRSLIGKARKIDDFRLIGCMDRAQLFLNGAHLATQYDQEIGEKLTFDLSADENELGVLVENMGRVNYSVKMAHQQKGISDGVIINGAFQSQWDMYSLPMEDLSILDFTLEWQPGQPAFYQFNFSVSECGDTFIDMTGWGKGFVVVNGNNIGRFWEHGPQKRLYIPAPFLIVGENELIVFESEGVAKKTILLTDTPDLGESNAENSGTN
ncbi:beta-galactosidase family protein [uncultured Enterococcus sp.]|uniref:glycoside hydrolase family 35 protein n=1 Tax=uncultured Enterococcus sp. TaxID=167972 RepID=UPI002AA8430E|nr:beta-galactosidase family protein [uncultured Enterococcus sp.]